MMSTILIIAGILFFVVLFFLYRAQQLTSVLSGDFKTKIPSGNKLNATIMLIVFFVGMIAFVYSTVVYWDDMNVPLASEHGKTIDSLYWITMAICTFIFIAVNALLFGFSFVYQHKDDYKAYFFPHNNTLEMIWTIVPAIVLSVLIFGGYQSWKEVTGAAPEDSAVVEVMGKQFAWMVRYPGDDKKLGNSHYTLIDDVNEFGMDCQDKNGYDDFIPREIHLVVNKPVLFKIRARDVLHSMFLPHFRAKMDAVPGMPTRFWLTPTKTTKEMQEETGNPKFKYEMACAEVCGRGHFAMKKIVVVETQEEYNIWYAKQKPFFKLNEDKACLDSEKKTVIENVSVKEETTKIDTLESVDIAEVHDHNSEETSH